jgi:YidC/Oxa1 family membrane protein insertase
MEKDNSRNTILFVICAVAMLLLYQVFVLQPSEQRRQAEARNRAAAVQANPIAAAVPGGEVFVNRPQAVGASPRVEVDTPALSGSVNLRGARLDDLFLKDYRQTIARDAPPVELFRPEGAKQAYFTDVGWIGAANAPTPNTVWTLTSGSRLTPTTPLTLTHDAGQGLVFSRTIAVDDRYMFTVTDTVANRGAAPVQIAPYASVQRQGLPADLRRRQEGVDPEGLRGEPEHPEVRSGDRLGQFLVLHPSAILGPGLVGNFGVAILLLTVALKIVLLPAGRQEPTSRWPR